MKLVTWVAIGCTVIVLGFIVALAYMQSSASAAELARLQRAQDELRISYAFKNKHPWKGLGDSVGFVINGVEGRTLHLKRNRPYRFVYEAPAGVHPFYLTMNARGGRHDVVGRIPFSMEPFDGGIQVFTFDDRFPDTFYYQCSTHDYMGGIIHLRSH